MAVKKKMDLLTVMAIAATGLLLYIVAGAGCFFVDDIYVLLLLPSILGSSCRLSSLPQLLAYCLAKPT